jgi:ribosome-associated protein
MTMSNELVADVVTGAVGEDTQRLLVAAGAVASRKAADILGLDIRKIASFADYFLICSGTSVRQVQAIADEVVERMRDRCGVRPLHIEGYDNGFWVLIDFGDVIVHVFLEESRQFYQLERLWRDADRVELPADV